MSPLCFWPAHRYSTIPIFHFIPPTLVFRPLKISSTSVHEYIIILYYRYWSLASFSRLSFVKIDSSFQHRSRSSRNFRRFPRQRAKYYYILRNANDVVENNFCRVFDERAGILHDFISFANIHVCDFEIIFGACMYVHMCSFQSE